MGGGALPGARHDGLEAERPSGAACYRPGGCAEIIERVARRIDAQRFNPAFPPVFPRYLQIAI